jgi:uncharacterized membrane protein
VIERGYFGRALRIVVNDPVIYLVGGALLLLVTLISFGLLIGPATCGIVWVTIRHCRGEQVAFSDLFRGFDNFSSSLMAGVVFTALVIAGLALGIVPGIILGALFCFVFPFIVERDMPLPEAMVASRRIPGPEDLLDRCVFFLVLLVLALSGLALALVGFVFTWALAWTALAVAYEDLAAGSRDSDAAPDA